MKSSSYPSPSLQASLSQKTSDLSSISQKILQLKQSVWEAEAKKQYLQQKLEENKSPWDSAVFFSELKSKFERCKGTCIEKVLKNLIKSYEQYQKTSQSLSSINSEKAELLLTYKEITESLSLESNLKSKLSEIQEILASKEKTTESLKNRLESLRSDFNQLKNALDNGQVKKMIQEKREKEEELEKCIEDQGILSIEIEKICQLIETEKNVSHVTPDTANRVLKLKIKETENLLAETVQKTRTKEKIREKLKLSITKTLSTLAEATGKSFPSPSKSLISPNKSLLTEKPTRSKAFTPKTLPASAKTSMSTPVFKFSEKNSLKSLLANPAPFKAPKLAGSESQSFASKIVQLNRGSFFN